jgi:carbonic anhydrase
MVDRLVEGYRRFRGDYFVNNREHLTALAERQTPSIAIVSCCDSRVDPGIVFDARPGELFVIRNVANLVPPFEAEGRYHGTSAALEFAVTGLCVSDIVVLGHAGCGGIRALLSAEPSVGGAFVSAWMDIAAEARKEVLGRTDLSTAEERQCACEQSAVRLSLDNLLTFPWVAERVRQGRLKLHGWYYDLQSGRITRLEDDFQG